MESQGGNARSYPTYCCAGCYGFIISSCTVPPAFCAKSMRFWADCTFKPCRTFEEVSDLDDPGFTYPIITGDYKLGVNVHPWGGKQSLTELKYTSLNLFSRKIPEEAVDEESSNASTRALLERQEKGIRAAWKLKTETENCWNNQRMNGLWLNAWSGKQLNSRA